MFCDDMEHHCPPFSKQEPHYLREDLLDCMQKVVVDERLLSFCDNTCKGCVDCNGIHEIKGMLNFSSSVSSGLGPLDYITLMQDSYTMHTPNVGSDIGSGENIWVPDWNLLVNLNNLVVFYKHNMIGNLYSDLDTVSKCWASMYAYRRYSLTTESSSLLLTDYVSIPNLRFHAEQFRYLADQAIQRKLFIWPYSQRTELRSYKASSTI